MSVITMPIDFDATYYDSAADLLRMQGGAALDLAVYAVTHGLVTSSGKIGEGEEGVAYEQHAVTLTITNISATVKQKPVVDVRLPWDKYSGSITSWWESLNGVWKNYTPSGAETGLNQRPSDRFASQKNAHIYPCAAWETDDGKTFGISATMEYAGFMQRLIYSGSTWLRCAHHPDFTTEYQNIPDLLNPGESFTIKVWVRVVQSTGLAASIEAVRPLIDWYQDQYPGMLRSNRGVQWPAARGRVLSFVVSEAGGYPPVGDPDHRYYVSLPGTEGGKRFDQCANLAEAVQLIADRFGGVSALKTLGYRTIDLRKIGGDDHGYWPPEAISRMPAHLNTDASWWSLLDWQIRNRMRVSLYTGFAFSHQVAGDWDAERLAGYTGAVTIDGTVGEGSGAFACDKLDDVLTRTSKPVPAWTAGGLAAFRSNYHRAARFVAEMHFDTLPSALVLPIIEDEIEALRAAYPQCMFSAEPGIRTVLDHALCNPYILGFDNGPYTAPCPLMAEIQGVETTDLRYVVQIDEGGLTDNDIAEARGLQVEDDGGVMLRTGSLSKNSSNVSTPAGANTYGVGSSASEWEAEFDDWANAALEAAGARPMGNTLLAQATTTGADISAGVVEAISWTNTSSKGRWVRPVFRLSALATSAATISLGSVLLDGATEMRSFNHLDSDPKWSKGASGTTLMCDQTTAAAGDDFAEYVPPGYTIKYSIVDGTGGHTAATIDAMIVEDLVSSDSVYQYGPTSVGTTLVTLAEHTATKDGWVAWQVITAASVTPYQFQATHTDSAGTTTIKAEALRSLASFGETGVRVFDQSHDKSAGRTSTALTYLRAGEKLKVEMKRSSGSSSVTATTRVATVETGATGAGNNIWLAPRRNR